MRKYIITLGFSVLFFSCARQKQVWLGELQRSNAAEHEHITRIYFDKFGDLYPNNGIVIPYKAFFDPDKKKNTYKENINTGNLEYYYCKYPNELKILANSFGTPIANDCKETFKLVQQKINDKIAYDINKDLSNDRVLVVFTHGFNDPNPTGDFQELRVSIRNRFPQQKFSYLEVFWDGLTCNQGNPSLSLIWGRAQKNSSNVAIGLRMLLSKINNVPVRIITHSLGASVATGALFNTNSKWHDNNKEYLEFSNNTDAPNQDDIRLGMLAPAIPGANTFCDYNRRGKLEATPQRININRIVIGFNKNDLAVTKRAGKKDHAGIAGATNLGCNYNDEINKTRKAISALKYSQEQIELLIQQSDFTTEKQKVSEEHGLYYYMQNKDMMNDFLDKLFN